MVRGPPAAAVRDRGVDVGARLDALGATRRPAAAPTLGGFRARRGVSVACESSGVSTVDLIALVVIALTALSGFRRGLVVGVFSLAGLALGFYLGARFGPSLVGGDQARWLPLVALGGAMLCAAVGQAIGVMIGRSLRRGLLVLGPLRLSTTSAAGCSAPSPGSLCAGPSAPCSSTSPARPSSAATPRTRAILSTLNEELPPTRLIDTLAQIDPFAIARRPGRGRRRPDPAVLDSAGVNAAALSVVRVVGNACGLGIEGSGWVAGARPRRHERPRRRRDRRRRTSIRNDGVLLDAAGRLVRQDQRHRRAPRRRADGDAAPARRRGRGNAGRTARLPGQRPVRRDRRCASAASCRSSAATRTATSRRPDA